MIARVKMYVSAVNIGIISIDRGAIGVKLCTARVNDSDCNPTIDFTRIETVSAKKHPLKHASVQYRPIYGHPT